MKFVKEGVNHFQVDYYFLLYYASYIIILYLQIYYKLYTEAIHPVQMLNWWKVCGTLRSG